jgi:restriction endonuclease Mrr
MLPLLRLAGDGREHHFREAVEVLGNDFSLSLEERQQPLPSLGQPVFDNRVGWAKTYLVKARLLDAPRRLPSRGELREILGIKRREDRTKPALQIVRLKESAVRVRCRGEPVEHADALWFQYLEQLAEGGILAADTCDVPM